MTKKKSSIKEHWEMSDIRNPWQVAMWIVSNKEILRLIIILLIVVIIFLISQGFKYDKKDGLSYDPVVEKVNIERRNK